MQVHVLPGAQQERVHVPWYAALAFALIAVAGVVVVLGNPDLVTNVAAIGILVGDVVAGITFVIRARFLNGRERRAWTLVGVGLTVATSGIAVLALQLAAGGDPPTFGVSDGFFIVGYGIILLGIGSLPHTEGDGLQRARIAIDGTIGAIALGALAWVFIFEPIIVGLEGAPLADRVFGTLYPLMDVAIVVVVLIVTVRRSVLRFDARLLFFAGAVLLQGIADVSYLVEGVGKSFVDAEPLYLAYLGATGLFLTTALLVDRVPRAREYAERRLPLWSMVVPYTAAAVMVVALLYRLWDASLDSGDRVLLVATLIVAILVIARQAISIRENRILVEQQRSELVSSISHELRTPLTSMVGFMAVLQNETSLSAPERREMMNVVVEQTAYLERLVEDLLGLAHGDPKRMELHVAEHDVGAVVESALTSSSVDRTHVSIEVQPGLLAVIDGSRIQQILVNLLTNAAWYGGADVLVCAFARAGGLVLEVHDSGSGVPKKYELTIWERFERGENRYNANVPGSGIGLAMVKSIAESHGGTAGYRRSDRLGGACFFVDLPGRVGKQRPIAIVSSSTMAIG